MSAVVLHDAVARQAEGHYSFCMLCEHRCGVDRRGGELGRCKAGAEARVFRQRVESGEELELIPSHLLYLSGCDLRCAFCIAEENAFDPSRGELLTADLLRKSIPWGRSQGARNLQWVGGEPTIHLPAILAAMAHCTDLPPIVWKSDFYGTPEAFELLADAVDIYVADFKFGNDACAERIASVSNYTAIVTRNFQIAARNGDLIVRHLLLPGHFDCCFVPIAQSMRDHLPSAKFSIREGYLPRWRARGMSDLGQLLSPADARRARALAKEYRLNVIV
jgi:putative pyruvate formate lyase activating enzyme